MAVEWTHLFHRTCFCKAAVIAQSTQSQARAGQKVAENQLRPIEFTHPRTHSRSPYRLAHARHVDELNGGVVPRLLDVRVEDLAAAVELVSQV